MNTSAPSTTAARVDAPPRILVTTAYLSPGGEVDQILRAAGFDVSFSHAKDRAISGVNLHDIVGDVDAIVAGTDAFTAEVIAAAPRLKIFGRCGVGYDNIDVAAATANGVAVTFTPGANRISVAEHVLALMLNSARLIPQNIAGVRAGHWHQRSGRELSGATLGIIGLGSIGKTVADMALGLGMRVIAFDSYIDRDFVDSRAVLDLSLEEVLRQSDFLSLHIFLDDSTRNLINADTLALMKPGSFLINTSRGEVIDENALADALDSGRLAGAGLDVVQSEPLPADSRLRQFENVFITAHIGAATVEARSRSSVMAAHQVIDGLNGRTPANLVNPESGAFARRTSELRKALA